MFDTKFAIVVRDDLAVWQKLNVVAFLSTGVAAQFPALIGDVWRDRGFGDFWGYALVAEGAAEAMVEVGPKSWDLAAPLVIIEEAGGRLTDLEGDRTIHSGTVLASNGLLHEDVLGRLRG